MFGQFAFILQFQMNYQGQMLIDDNYDLDGLVYLYEK
jgi:hypothetical protein